MLNVYINIYLPSFGYARWRAEALQLLLCSALCFLFGKFGNTAAKTLKSALLDYYDDGALSAAKQQLLKDGDNINHRLEFIFLPHVIRREGDHRAEREVDDIFTILNALDERSAISKLPTYVTDGPDKNAVNEIVGGRFLCNCGHPGKNEQ